MKKHRPLAYILIGIGVVIVSCVLAVVFSAVAARKAELEIGARYGDVGTASELSAYFDSHVVEGQSQDEVFAFFRKGNPNAIVHTSTLGNVLDVHNASCFRVRFDDLLDGDLLLNRIICFDGDKKLIFIANELSFY